MIHKLKVKNYAIHTDSMQNYLRNYINNNLITIVVVIVIDTITIV